MLTLNYKTRGNSPPQGKERVYFSAHPDDFSLYYQEITDDILHIQNCAIYSDPDPSADRTLADIQFELDRMQLLVIPITANFLYKENRARCIEFSYALEKHIPVLPLMYEPGLEKDFNRICGDLQFLDKHNTSFQPLPYEQKLKKYLDSVLLGDELAEQVRQAFDAYIFLSYRKKDRVHAQKLMSLIHQNDFCRDIAIWYDEYLTPGESFHDAIATAMAKSQLFALAVTPNLVNETNYVMTVEYPEAVKAQKPILPVEMESTDRQALEQNYENIPQSIHSHNCEDLANALKENLKAVALAENNNDPQHLFFMGLAYLNGIDVEIDHERAVKLITQAAQMGLVAAMEKLLSMYTNGEGVAVDFAESAFWAEQLAEGYRKKLGESHPQTLLVMFNLAVCYHNAGRIGDAIALYRQILPLQIDSLGEEHPDVLNTLDSLSHSLLHTGDLSSALKTAEQVAALRTRVQGEADPCTLKSTGQLAAVCYSAGQLQRALKLTEKLMDTCKQALGEEDPVTLDAMRSLARLYRDSGRMPEAITLIGKILDCNTRMYGKEHPHTLHTMYNLADLCIHSGMGQQAIALNQHVLDHRMKIWGETHPETLYSMHNLAVSYQINKQPEMGLPWMEKAVQIQKQVLGEQHPDTLLSKGSLAGMFIQIRQYPHAVKLLEEVVEARGKLLGKKHPDTVGNMQNLAEAYLAIGEQNKDSVTKAKAFALYEEVLQLQSEIWGSSHFQVMKTTGGLAIRYTTNGEIEKAYPLWKKYYTHQFHADPKSDVLDAMTKTAALLFNAGKIPEALAFYEKMTELYSQLWQERDPKSEPENMLFAWNRLASFYYDAGLAEKYLALTEKCLDLSIRIYGENHMNTLSTMSNLAMGYNANGRTEEAVVLLLKVTNLSIQPNSKLSSETQTFMTNLTDVFHQLKTSYDPSLAEEYYKTCSRVLGPSHKETQWADQQRSKQPQKPEKAGFLSKLLHSFGKNKNNS